MLLVVVPLAVAFGLWRMRVDGRFSAPVRSSAPSGARPQEVAAADPLPSASLLSGTPWEGELGTRATLLQFSSAFCAPCRTTRRVLSEVVEVVPDVAHVEVDAELHLDLVRRLDVMRTPTTLVLDAAGREVTRAAGAPTKDQVLRALALTGGTTEG